MQPWVQGASVIAIDDLAGVEETTQHSTAQHSRATLFLYLSYLTLSWLILGRKIPF
jgi:hypothetical protein